MKSIFSKIVYGPFEAKYHRENADDAMKNDLESFLERELLPQVTIRIGDASGSIQALYDDDKSCGPYSAVRGLYVFSFCFRDNGDTEEIEEELVYKREKRAWQVRGGIAPVLDTVRRKRDRVLFAEKIEDLVSSLLETGEAAGACPVCGKDLNVTNSNEIFWVGCTGHCFFVHFHRDPETGEFLHGSQAYNF